MKRIKNAIPVSPTLFRSSAFDAEAPSTPTDHTATALATANTLARLTSTTPATAISSELAAAYKEAVNIAHLLDDAYWNKNAPLVSDDIYDAVYCEIAAFEKKYQYSLPDSPTNYLGLAPANGRRQVLRRTTMLSTEKAQTIDAVCKWMTKTRFKLSGPTAHIFTLEWKYDGVSLSLVYVHGVLTEASEGKGDQGNDVMRHCQWITGIPQTIPALESEPRIEVRGEVVMPFVLLNQTDYKNCRSAAAGIMANGASTQKECSLLSFYPWWVEGLDIQGRIPGCPLLNLDKQETMMNELQNLGFSSGYTLCNVVGTAELKQEIENFTAMRDDLTFPTDGIVIKVASKSLWDDLGKTDHHPKCMIAYKFPAQARVTTVRRIEITIGEKTGKRTPVAYFDPVVINGATYQKCSIGSEAKQQELGIYVGSRVKVSLRNDVIPHIDCVV